VKGEEALWRILCDKLEMLLAGQRLVEALRVGEKTLDLAQRVFPENHPSLGLTYERLGSLHDQQDHVAEARTYLGKALRIVEATEPRDQRTIYRLARRLAYLQDFAGTEEEAIASYEKAIAAAAALGNIPHFELGTMLNNVALIYRKIGQPRAAEPYYMQALELYEKQLGPNHPDVAAVLNNLGVFYANEERFDEAERVHQRALAIRSRANPKVHADVAQSNCNLAVVYHSLGEHQRAIELYRESLRNWEKMAKPPEDYQIAASNYADLLRSLGKRHKAGAIESRARRRRR
jgi:tetratricopeptide (TPR) repeat protein